MTGELLQTKLYVPRLRPSFIPRPHLIQQLTQGLHRKLTLISAPAGFGKTTVVTEWLADGERPFAWLSLDERDSDLSRFLTYFVAALQTAVPGIGQRVVEILQGTPQPATDALLTTLLNEIATAPQEFILVLDDYHVVEAQPVDQALTFLLDHLPPQLHLVMTTREDPPLPLPRLRVRGQLTEIRAADLRFTAEETAVFLNKTMRLNLTAEEVAALESRTEGWIAGLQLAALSMQGHSDAHSFITAFAGDNRYVVDYLVAEVLQRQPPHLRQFLLQTAILERLCDDLCTAVTHQKNSGELLETLERGNLFVIPLDDRRQWYRYHHLFADVLQAYAQKEDPNGVTKRHQRASHWHEVHDLLPEAVRHALAAHDFERVADLAEHAWPAMDRNRESHVWLGWVKKLPAQMLHSRPVLSASYAWAMLDKGELETAESHLQAVEQWLAQTDISAQQPPAYVDEAQFRALPATIAAARTYLSLALYDLPATQKYARQALQLIPQNDHHRRGTPAALLGLATWASGELVAAYDAFSQAMTSYQQAGNTLYAITGTFILADIRLAQGLLPEAVRIYEHALQLAQNEGGAALRGTADLHLGLADLWRERNELTMANDHLQTSQVLNQTALLPRWQHRLCLVQARLKEAAGDLDGALALLDEAERQYVRGPVPDVRPIAALKARLWVLQGNLVAAIGWAQTRKLTSDDKLSYLHEFEHLTLARVLIARAQMEAKAQFMSQAIALLGRLLAAAEAGGRTGSVVEILIQQALAEEVQANHSRAVAHLQQALTLAAPAGYVRLFVDEGEPLARLLNRVQADSAELNRYVSRLRSAFALATGTQPPVANVPLLLEPLSDRELEVLRLVADGLTNHQIADRLYLALSTVKGHNRIIYSKLNVSRRTEAVARARELGIL